jgi:hypothetical protein
MDPAAHAAGPDPVEQLAATAGAYVRYVVRRGAGLNVIFAPGLEHLHDEELVDAGRDLMSAAAPARREHWSDHSRRAGPWLP